jgi:hypothetical protein
MLTVNTRLKIPLAPPVVKVSKAASRPVGPVAGAKATMSNNKLPPEGSYEKGGADEGV